MKELGITALRPGKNGNPESTVNRANYYVDKTTPFNALTALLESKNGKAIKSPSECWRLRRPEIVKYFENEFYGKVPDKMPILKWEFFFDEREMIGWTPVTVKKLVGHVNNTSYPNISDDISMVVVTPANMENKVPILMMYCPAEIPAPRQPRKTQFEYLNNVLLNILNLIQQHISKIVIHICYQSM